MDSFSVGIHEFLFFCGKLFGSLHGRLAASKFYRTSRGFASNEGNAGFDDIIRAGSHHSWGNLWNNSHPHQKRRSLVLVVLAALVEQ